MNRPINIVVVSAVAIIALAGNLVQYEKQHRQTNQSNTSPVSTLANNCGTLGIEASCQYYTDELFGFNVRYPIKASLSILAPSFDVTQRSIDINNSATTSQGSDAKTGDSNILEINVTLPGADGNNPAEREQILRQSGLPSYQAGYTAKNLGANSFYTFNADVAANTTNAYGASLQGLIFGKNYTYEFYFKEADRALADNIIGTFQLR